MKRIITILAIALASIAAHAQTDIQLHYDFGKYCYPQAHLRHTITSTIEGDYADWLGNTAFRVDLNFETSKQWSGMQSVTLDAVRNFKFYDYKGLNLDFHIEYNGQMWYKVSKGFGWEFCDAWLFGFNVGYTTPNKEFNVQLTPMYRLEAFNKTAKHNFQLSAQWTYNFYHDAFTFGGWADVILYNDWNQGFFPVFVAEPQFWVNMRGFEETKNVNLSFGTELKLSWGDVRDTFAAVPTIAVKYTF